MGIQIEDGTGTGRKLSIDLRNRGEVNAQVADRIHYVSKLDAEAYSFANATYNYAAGDTVLLLRNDNPEKDFYLTRMWLQGDTATEIVAHCPTLPFTPTGTDITGSNGNRGSGRTALATCIQNETQNTQGDVLWRGAIVANGASLDIYLQDAVILGYHNSLGIDYVTDGGATRATLWGYFE
jgi:hypothetical protein